jgi:hypothetical protein
MVNLRRRSRNPALEAPESATRGCKHRHQRRHTRLHAADDVELSRLRNASDTVAATVTAREGARLEYSDREAVLGLATPGVLSRSASSPRSVFGGAP